MSLVKSTLVNGLRGIFDVEYSGFKDWPSSLDDAANKWGNTINNYARIVVPVSITSVVARTAFVAKFLLLDSVNDVSGMSDAIKVYADVLGSGMAPAFTYTIPNIGPDLTPVKMLGLSGGSSKQCIDLMSTIIDIWFRTCTAQNTISGGVVFWQ